MTTNSIAELISLTLTSPTVISSFLVVCIFTKPACRALFTKQKRTAYQWLILGVTASFVGGVIDNIWWGSAWGRLYLHHPSWHWWFDNGVFSNIPFRQVAGIIAASCHLKSVWEGGEDQSWKMSLFNGVMLLSIAISIGIWLALAV